MDNACRVYNSVTMRKKKTKNKAKYKGGGLNLCNENLSPKKQVSQAQDKLTSQNPRV